MQWEDLNYKQEFKMGFKAYGQSKLANILFTKHLSKKLLHKGISVNCVHPGGVNTALGSQNKSMLGKLLKILLKMTITWKRLMIWQKKKWNKMKL